VVQAKEYAQLQAQIDEGLKAKLKTWHKTDECSQRLRQRSPGVRPDRGGSADDEDPGRPSCSDRGDSSRAWLGLTPEGSFHRRQRSGSAASTRAGDEALRAILVSGATAVIQQAVRYGGRRVVLARRPSSSASRRSWPPWRWPTRMARVAWKLMVTGEAYIPKIRTRCFRRARPRDQPDTGSNSTATVLSRCQNLQDNMQMV